jgi:hypothetical protein
VPSTSKTFVGLERIDGTTDVGPNVFFGSEGTAGDAAMHVVCLEAVYESSDAGYTRVHYLSDLDTTTLFGAAIWYHRLPELQWFHWALTVVDNGATQSIELFINGVSQGAADLHPSQPTFHANAGNHLLGIRGQGSAVPTAAHAVDGAHGLQAVFDYVLSRDQIRALAITANLGTRQAHDRAQGYGHD